MNLDGLADAYTLSPLTVSPTQLLLDPSNPRLVTEFSQDRQYSDVIPGFSSSSI